MTVIPATDTVKDNSSVKFYVHLQNLPFCASQRDIREFFSGLVIPEGGILIRGSEAFILFHKQEDIRDALLRDERMIRGCVIKLSAIGQRELNQILMQKTRRMLVFTPLDCKTVNKEGYPKLIPFESKKIRPTRVNAENKRSKVKCLVFLPEEVEFPTASAVGRQATKCYYTDVKQSADIDMHDAGLEKCTRKNTRFSETRKTLGKRKIHPTPVREEEEWELKYLFETVDTPQVKKLKLLAS